MYNFCPSVTLWIANPATIVFFGFEHFSFAMEGEALVFNVELDYWLNKLLLLFITYREGERGQRFGSSTV
jgi:hypothetical protein